MNHGEDRRRDNPAPEDPELSRIYRQRMPEEPPGALDDAICAAARREVGAGPRVAARRRFWYVPVSVAAVLVLSVTLTLMMREQEETALLTPAPVPAQPSATEKGIPPVARDVSPQPQTSKIAPAPRRQDSAPKPEARPFPAPTGPAAKQAAGAAPASSPPVGARAVPPAPLAEETAKKAEESGVRQEAATGDVAPGKPAAAAPAMREGKTAADSVQGLRRSGDPAGSELAPEQWLQKIRELRREGRFAEAEASLVEFRKRFPGYRLPEDLRQTSGGAGDGR